MYRHQIEEKSRTLKLWVRPKRGNKVLICSGCGGRCTKIVEIREREVRAWPVAQISDHRGDRVLPVRWPAVRIKGGSRRAVAEQSTV